MRLSGQTPQVWRTLASATTAELTGMHEFDTMRKDSTGVGRAQMRGVALTRLPPHTWKSWRVPGMECELCNIVPSRMRF